MAKRVNLSKQYIPSVEPDDTEIRSPDIESISMEEKPAIVIPEAPKYNKGISNTIQLRSTLDAIYKTIGAVSGREYVFYGGGSIVDVNKEDVDEFLSRRRGRSCCGGNPTQSFIFELV